MTPSSPASPPLVSIVVPVFGTEQYLADCLESILRQSLRQIEIVVVDDCSPGDVSGIIDRVAGTDERVRLIRHEVNSGVLQARLTGVGAARGEYVGFVDSDDLVEPWFVETLHAVAINQDADFVQCALTVSEVDGSTWLLNRGGARHNVRGDAIVHGLLAGKMSNSLCNKLIRTTTFRSAMRRLEPDWRSVSFAEDLLLLFLIALESSRYSHVPDAGYRYLRRPNSIRSSPGSASVSGRMCDLGRVYEALHPILVNRGDPLQLVEAFLDREFRAVTREMFAEFTVENEPSELLLTPAVVHLLGGDHMRSSAPDPAT